MEVELEGIVLQTMCGVCVPDILYAKDISSRSLVSC